MMNDGSPVGLKDISNARIQNDCTHSTVVECSGWNVSNNVRAKITNYLSNDNDISDCGSENHIYVDC